MGSTANYNGGFINLISLMELIENKQMSLNLQDVTFTKPKKEDIEKTFKKDIMLHGKKVKLTFVKTKDKMIHPVKIKTKKEEKTDADISK